MSDFSAWRKRCETAKGGRKEPYEDEPCEHEYGESEGGLICALCGDRQPIDLTDLLR